MIEDLRVRNYSRRTVEAYVAAVAKVARYFMRSPDQLNGEDLREFQVGLLAKQPSWSQFNQIVAGVRFFFGTTVARPAVGGVLSFCKKATGLAGGFGGAGGRQRGRVESGRCSRQRMRAGCGSASC